jgi:hypothetical protein
MHCRSNADGLAPGAARRVAPQLIAASGLALVALMAADVSAGQRGAQPPAQPQQPRTAKTAAPIDLTGYWVSVVTEDWRWRMLTPSKGDYASVPLNQEARKVGDTWDLAKDEASGNACKPFGVGNIMRMPGRVHITWQDDSTLKLEFDAGTQTRLLRFDATPPPAGAERTWQGYSVAEWEVAGQQLDLDRNGIPTGAAAGAGAGGGAGAGRGRGGRGARGGAPRGGSLKVETTKMREGYLRKNGVPYSDAAVVSEYFDRLGPEPNGDVILIVRTVVDDPKYLTQPFITSTHFKLEPNGSKWNPTPCKIDPPLVGSAPR